MGKLEKATAQQIPPPYQAGSMSGPPPVYPRQPGVQQEVFNVAHAQSGVYPNHTVVITTPGRIYTPHPVNVECTSCHQQVITKTEFENGLLTWLIAGGTCLLGGMFGCCFIPFCINGCKDVLHTCPNCNSFIGRYKRLN